jgi:hypothetical protein
VERESDSKGVGLEIDGGRIHFRIGGMTAPRSMPYADCAGVSLRLAPMVTGLGMNLRYRVDLLGRDFEPAILIGDSGNLIEARDIWRRAAGKLELPAVEATPDGVRVEAGAGPPPANISLTGNGGPARVVIRRGKLEFIFVSALAAGLAVVLVLGDRSADNAFFMALAAGLLGYAVIGGLSARFIDIADGTLTAGTRTPLGDFATVKMPLAEVETILWGKAENRRGNSRAGFVLASAETVKSFARLTDDQARWLRRFMRDTIRSAG